MQVEAIKNLKIEGRRRFEFVERTDHRWERQRRHLDREFGISLPANLRPFGKRRDLRVLCARVRADIRLDNGAWLQFEFLPGYITDLASVPSWLRGLIDNDDERLIIAVLIHDYLYTTHGLPFAMSNDLFYSVARKCGYPRFKARLAHMAVNSIFARRRWNKSTGRAWVRTVSQMLIPRPFDCDGTVYTSLPLLNKGALN